MSCAVGAIFCWHHSYFILYSRFYITATIESPSASSLHMVELSFHVNILFSKFYFVWASGDGIPSSEIGWSVSMTIRVNLGYSSYHLRGHLNYDSRNPTLLMKWIFANTAFLIPFGQFIVKHIAFHLKKSTSDGLIYFLLCFENPCHKISYPVWGNTPLAKYIFPILFSVPLPKFTEPHFIHKEVHSNI